MFITLDQVRLRNIYSIISYDIALQQSIANTILTTMFSTAATYLRSLSKTDGAIGACILGVTLYALLSSFDGGTKHHRTIDRGYVSSRVRRLPFSGRLGWGLGPKKRLALIRPFAPGDDDGQKLLDSFDLWHERWPCSEEDNEYDVDLVLSYSRSLNIDTEDAKVASDIVDEIRSKFIADEESGGYGWSECFAGMRVIEANLDVSSVGVSI